VVGLVSSTPGGIFGYRIISTRGELEGTVSFEESSLSSVSVETEEDVISQREGKEEGLGSGNEGGYVHQQQQPQHHHHHHHHHRQQQHDPEKTIGDGVEAQDGKATEAVVQSPEALAGQKIACSPMHSLEAKVETEDIGRGGEGAGNREEGRFAQQDLTQDELGNKEGTPAGSLSRAGSVLGSVEEDEEGKESAFTFDVDSQTLETFSKVLYMVTFIWWLLCSGNFYIVNGLTFLNLYQEIALAFMMELHRTWFSQREVRHAQGHLDEGKR
jgi:hypothetical protein